MRKNNDYAKREKGALEREGCSDSLIAMCM